MDALADESVHLVVTSPPYWTLKEYPVGDGQLGYVADYDEFWLNSITYGNRCTVCSCQAAA
jgi:DNA modification methylase